MPKVKPAAASTVKKRTQYTVEMKTYAQQLHKDGYSNSAIREKVFIRFDALTEKPPISTVSTWYNDHNMTNYTGMAEGPETSERKRLFTSRKKQANRVAKPKHVAKPHCATCTCSVVININENAATEKDDATITIKREDDAATTTEDDAATTPEYDADTATEGDAATDKTYFRPIRDNEPRVYTVGKLSPRDSSSESVGPHTTPIKRSNSKLTNVVSETNINVIMYYVIFYYIILFYYFETFHEYNTMFSCILTLSFILNLI